MTGKTHVTFAAAAGYALGAPPEAFVPLVIGSLLPDVDLPCSTLGKFLPLGYFIKHRTVTHSILAIIGAFCLNAWLGIGVLTHILLDMLTPGKVRLLWPLKSRIGIGFIQTGGIGEKFLYAGTLVAAGLLFYRDYGEQIRGFLAYYGIV